MIPRTRFTVNGGGGVGTGRTKNPVNLLCRSRRTKVENLWLTIDGRQPSSTVQTRGGLLQRTDRFVWSSTASAEDRYLPRDVFKHVTVSTGPSRFQSRKRARNRIEARLPAVTTLIPPVVRSGLLSTDSASVFADGNGTLVVADNVYDSDRMGPYRAGRRTVWGPYRAGQLGVTPTPLSCGRKFWAAAFRNAAKAFPKLPGSDRYENRRLVCLCRHRRWQCLYEKRTRPGLN